MNHNIALTLAKIAVIAYCCVVVVTIVMLAVWWSEDNPVTVMERFAYNPTVRTGEQLHTYNDIVVTRACDVVLHRLFVDSDSITHMAEPEVISWLETPGRHIYVTNPYVPKAMAGGFGKYSAVAQCYCNPMHRWWRPLTVYFPTIEVYILEGPAEGAEIVPLPDTSATETKP